MKFLSSVGFSVRESQNGQEAIEVWKNWHPHLIWMDMRMPIMNGFEATQYIKSTTKGKETVIIALTASAFEDERKQILAAGCDDFVRKPFREQIIFETIAQYLNVRYLYDTDEQEEYSNSLLTCNRDPLDLSVMSIEWIKKLHQAAEQCSDDQVLEIIKQIPSQYYQLASALRDLSHNFFFDQIIHLTSNYPGLKEAMTNDLLQRQYPGS
jgi:two-component system, sensor histidine kinase and response regulator